MRIANCNATYFLLSLLFQSHCNLQCLCRQKKRDISIRLNMNSQVRITIEPGVVYYLTLVSWCLVSIVRYLISRVWCLVPSVCYLAPC